MRASLVRLLDQPLQSSMHDPVQSDHPELDDAHLIVRLRNGDPQALDTIVRTYAPSLIEYVSRKLDSEDRAQDVVQEVFWQLWRDRSRLDVTFHLSVYLFWLTRNRAIDLVRSESKARVREKRWMTREDADRVSENAGASLIDSQDARAEVWEVLSAVPPRSREIFMLVWDRQMTYAEVAALLGISVPTVRNQMSRALRMLVKTLGGEADFR